MLLAAARAQVRVDAEKGVELWVERGDAVEVGLRRVGGGDFAGTETGDEFGGGEVDEGHGNAARGRELNAT